ncbi:TetR/AcrR family transcriptional regulator [Streptomyces sp. NBC_00249]|uniref:TetR/AcrR family transcriptional regulator n=1 Tax=Streptomyces sp. NBC_00249 TaxID=2975690 RepID=UPI0022563A44|nr:TetR/AcrR family transcriptional regulator [Streptomyces sp. NBC_00249]MCX5199243.1 TetR/AcrR family transcriptional regulator [Streptomyces sp. NBC_00249]
MPDEPTAAPGQRADAQRNRERILEAAAEAVREQGTQASLRDVARRTGVGLGTLYRHFPTRDALLEALLRTGFDHLAARADELLADRGPTPERALADWLGEFTLRAGAFRGLPASLMATLGDPDSALHASCLAMREAGGRLLRAAQDAGAIRPDVDGTDLFALVNALSWVADQAPSIAARRAHLLTLITDGLAHPGTGARA